ncbi:hypothetical protein BT96DRAFT_103031 [Gymnopus androsaceus JB14]|uniref:Uncharacterized protein n=1 Tax=Gymnopus androsaceus JB14 TaxID=1447944 RepID=A0A6A4IFN5_9AGAR|nr:hypothetical protein BT96DRAFT_103031 [Gymnopus androsaceus JB14]
MPNTKTLHLNSRSRLVSRERKKKLPRTTEPKTVPQIIHYVFALSLPNSYSLVRLRYPRSQLVPTRMNRFRFRFRRLWFNWNLFLQYIRYINPRYSDRTYAQREFYSCRGGKGCSGKVKFEFERQQRKVVIGHGRVRKSD